MRVYVVTVARLDQLSSIHMQCQLASQLSSTLPTFINFKKVDFGNELNTRLLAEFLQTCIIVMATNFPSLPVCIDRINRYKLSSRDINYGLPAVFLLFRCV